MEDSKMQVIAELMEELQGMMEPSADEFGERLGRKKPEVEVMKIEAEDPEMGLEEDFESPEEKLKSRLLKLRG